MSTDRPAPAAAPATVSTHVLDTSAGRPAAYVAVRLSARAGADGAWAELGASSTDTDGRCTDLPALPAGTSHARLLFEVEPYLVRTVGEDGGFFPEAAVVFAVHAGEHYHVPLLLNPYGYSVYRGS